MTYRARIADRELVRRLDANGAVVIEGVKVCGKTATARQVAASEVLLDSDENARRALAVDPALVLEGAVPRLLDEWQIEPAIWNHVRRAVDDSGRGCGAPPSATTSTRLSRWRHYGRTPKACCETSTCSDSCSSRWLFATCVSTPNTVTPRYCSIV